MKNTIEVECKTKGFEEALEKVEALTEAADIVPAQMSIKNVHDCTFNIYPQQHIVSVSEHANDAEKERGEND